MTTEEKAKAYDEAIEKINGYSTDKYGCLLGIKPSDIFPQLKESEDEKIRKFLINFIKLENGITLHPIDGKRCIAYLEKQKEKPKTVDSISADCVSDVKWADTIITRAIVALSDDVDYNRDEPCKYRREIDDLKKLRDVFCGQKEQKPAEWSEDYRGEDLQTRFAFYTYKDEDDVLYLSNVFVEETCRNKGFGTKILQAAEKVAETIGAISIRLKVKQDSPANAWYRKHGYGYITFEDGYDWLEKTLEYLEPIKQEWSEGIKKTLDEISDYLKYKGREEDADFIRHLRPQPKAEWTIKDAKPGDILTTDTVTFIFKSVDKNGFVSMYCSYAVSTTGTNFNLSDTSTVDSKYVHPASIEQRREFLEELLRHMSSQSHWIPSEEQVKAIDLAIRFVTDDFDEHPTLSETLRGLYNELKKL